MKKFLKVLLLILSHLLVGVLAVAVTLMLLPTQGSSKLDKLQNLIEERFIGQVDSTAVEDAAAHAMIGALGDEWSYYLPASSYGAYLEQKHNSYVGIGVTIQAREDNMGFDVLLVEPGGPAQEGGVMPGDIMTHVEGEPVSELGINATGDKVRGPEGTTVNITFLRGEEVLELTLERRTIQVAVAEYKMLPDNIGYIKINNFNSKCADETIAAVDALIERGARALIFDVRNNPGGYVDELVAVLDHLLPEGVLFRSESYDGKQTIRESDKKCIELPMAVLFNGESYSAAEFFAAALEEYDWAITVGDPTCGKSYYQNTFELGDGSAVGLSTGKYSTPNGVVLAEVGGLTPQILVEVDDQTAAMIYADMLEPEDDPQLQAAIAALK